MPQRDVPLVSPFNRLLGAEVEDLADGSVRVSLDTDDRFLNELGAIHGGAIASLLDGALGRCCGMALGAGDVCATVQLSIQYLAPAMGRLVATGRISRMGGSIAHLEGECVRDDGTVVARAHGVWAIRRAKR